jgi:hypothetical protein
MSTLTSDSDRGRYPGAGKDQGSRACCGTRFQSPIHIAMFALVCSPSSIGSESPSASCCANVLSGPVGWLEESCLLSVGAYQGTRNTVACGSVVRRGIGFAPSYRLNDYRRERACVGPMGGRCADRDDVWSLRKV